MDHQPLFQYSHRVLVSLPTILPDRIGLRQPLQTDLAMKIVQNRRSFLSRCDEVEMRLFT
jgi:hypothetical protein